MLQLTLSCSILLVLPTPRETLTGKSEKRKGTSTNTQPQLRYRPYPPGVRGGAFKLCKRYWYREMRKACQQLRNIKNE